MVNIFDVAKAAGVSKSTVSRVFSGKGYVSDHSRRAVLAAADQLGYMPSLLARQFREQSTRTIGFIAKTYYPAVGDLLNYISHLVEQRGYKINVYFTKTRHDELEILNSLKLHALDGLFFVANRNPWSIIEKFTAYGPITTWRRIDHSQIYSSYIDHYPLYQQILAYIVKQYGVVNIGHILNDRHKNNTKARLKAIKEFEHHYPNRDNSWQVFFPEQGGAGESAAIAFLKAKQKPEVIIAYSDYVAAGFISKLENYHFTIPQDVKVFGFDNSDFGQYLKLSTVDTHLKIQATNCLNKIFADLQGQPFKARKSSLIY